MNEPAGLVVALTVARRVPPRLFKMKLAVADTGEPAGKCVPLTENVRLGSTAPGETLSAGAIPAAAGVSRAVRALHRVRTKNIERSNFGDRSERGMATSLTV
ncbi:MAG TPA: hypothetical protein VFB58_16995 [Chloroflexota bacterium]|nr:hypothetical protein [Chloroflexota bacterium]